MRRALSGLLVSVRAARHVDTRERVRALSGRLSPDKAYAQREVGERVIPGEGPVRIPGLA
jgi:hypothetical protein